VVHSGSRASEELIRGRGCPTQVCRSESAHDPAMRSGEGDLRRGELDEHAERGGKGAGGGGMEGRAWDS
jgi:hypothetical protein